MEKPKDGKRVHLFRQVLGGNGVFKTLCGRLVYGGHITTKHEEADCKTCQRMNLRRGRG